MLKLAQAQGWLDRYSNALRWITRALRILDGAEDPEAQRQRAQLLAWYGRFCQDRGTTSAPSPGATVRSPRPSWPARRTH